MLPNDPVMLMSVINTKLRDRYNSFEELCDDMDVSQQELTDKLAAAGFKYDPALNQFR